MATLSATAFWICAALLLIAGLGVVFLRNLFHSVLALALVLLVTAGLFLTLNNEFVAAVQVLLYTGGVVTLVVFAIMLTQKLAGEKIKQTNRGLLGGLICATAVAALLSYSIYRSTISRPPVTPDLTTPLTAKIAQGILSEFVLPFEALSILLLGALIGALVLARGED